MNLDFFARTLINDPLLSKSAVLTIGGTESNIRVAYIDSYMKASMYNMDFDESGPYVMGMTSEVGQAVSNSSTIILNGVNNNAPFKIRSKQPREPFYTKLVLSRD